MQNQYSDKFVQIAENTHKICFSHGGVSSLYLTVPGLDAVLPGETAEMLNSLFAPASGWHIVRQTTFGPLQENIRGSAGGMDIEWPATLLSAGTPGAQPQGGVHVQALAGGSIQTLALGGRVLGMVYEDAHARYGILGGLVPVDIHASRPAQTLQVFEQMTRLLDLAGMDFSHVVRTWFYLDSILDWYTEFNRARDEFFSRQHRLRSILPASTGIGGKNGSGSALVAEALAVQPKSNQVRIQNVPSPLQGSACDYGSSFSRAIEIAAPDHTRLMVSGTASIAPNGQSLHWNDVDAQVQLTMSVVQAILKSRGLDWADTCRAFAYFKHAGDIGALSRYCASAGIASLPVVISENDVCRPELLFEIEVDAVVVKEPTKDTNL